MTNARYIQMHLLQGYAAVLLNRDEAGQAKRLVFGGESRTRISSQCLKRHWRTRAGADALECIPGVSASIRSRDTIGKRIIDPLAADGFTGEVLDPIGEAMLAEVYGENAADKGKRQPLLLGEQEVRYLHEEARKLAAGAEGDPKAASTAAKAWGKELKANLRAMRGQCSMPGGLWAACFGRMNTSDPDANIDGPLHVAHAFTTHAEEIDYDFFSVVDDLHDAADGKGGVDHINESELGCGLYYVYVMIDRDMLLANVDGDIELAGEIMHRLVRIITTVSPGARRGATAPYTRAAWMLVETGAEQPRTLAEAFRRPTEPTREDAQAKINDYLKRVDAIYGNTNARRALSIEGIETEGAAKAETLDAMASFAREAMTSTEATP